MESPAVAVAAAGSLSVTWTVKALAPLAVGVPLIVPVEASRARPAGRLPPETDHVYGCMPPAAASVSEYDSSANAHDNPEVVISSGATGTAGIVMKASCVPLGPESNPPDAGKSSD